MMIHLQWGYLGIGEFGIRVVAFREGMSQNDNGRVGVERKVRGGMLHTFFGAPVEGVSFLGRRGARPSFRFPPVPSYRILEPVVYLLSSDKPSLHDNPSYSAKGNEEHALKLADGSAEANWVGNVPL
jgi:hypothetical protein